jgi:glycosyltransferase involved in cell wall biosynthesis
MANGIGDGPGVLYVQNATLPTEWAHGFQIMKTCEQLAEAGFKLSLVVPNRRHGYQTDDPFEYYGIRRNFEIIRVNVLDYLGGGKFWQKISYQILLRSFIRSAHKCVSGRNEDVIYTRDPWVAKGLSGIGKRVYLELHDDPTCSRVWKRVKDDIAGYVVITKSLKALLISQGINGDAILVAPDAYDAIAFAGLLRKHEARQKLGLDQDKIVLLYAGQMMPWKGVDSLIPKLDTLPGDCILAMVGGFPDDLGRLKNMQPTTSSNVRWIGQKSRAEVLEWMAAADVGILPTSAKYNIGKLYTSPLKLFEYLAAGLPIIASDVPSSREILDDKCAIFFNPDDGNDFVKAVKIYLRMPEIKRKELSVQAKNRSISYTWSSRASSIYGFISKYNNSRST